jgi:hypothetical protein
MDSGVSVSTIDGYSSFVPRLDADQLRMIRTMTELKEGPIPTVLDTSCVRTGLQYQLANGRLPVSIDAARSGRTRLFMELDTLNETWERLPRFAEQLNVPLASLQNFFATDWLPLLSVVSIPEALRQVDSRATLVRDLDFDDYPAAALATLLSPCILLTHNHNDFRPLDIKAKSQGVDAVFAAVAIKTGEIEVQAILMIPAAPVVAIGVTAKWAADKVGPMAWVVLALLAAGGVVLYRQQPPERKAHIKHVASESGKFLVEEYTRATFAVRQAQNQLIACVVPSPEERSVMSAVFRKLALAEESLSAQQLCDVLDDSVRPAVDPLRRFLHGNKTTMFREVRRGGFVLGSRYNVPQSIEA